MKLHKFLLIIVTAFSLAACSESPADETQADANTSSEDLIEKAKEESEANESPGPIEFTYGVEDDVSYGDSDNYIDVEGFSYGADQIIVIYQDTVIDVVPTESGGHFSYYSKASDNKVPITFATNSDAKIGDTFYPGEAENEAVIAFIPNEEESDSSFSIGETAVFESGIEITINNVELTDERPNGDINGNFVRVDFTLDNQSSEPIKFNGHQMELYDGERNKAETNAKDWYSESIAAGMKGNGSVYFDSMAEGPFTIIIGAATWVSE